MPTISQSHTIGNDHGSYPKCPVDPLRVDTNTRELHIPHIHVFEEVGQLGNAFQALVDARPDLTTINVVHEYFAGSSSAREARRSHMEALLSKSPNELTDLLREALQEDASDSDLYLLGVAREISCVVHSAKAEGREINLSYDILESYRPMAAGLAWLAVGCQEEVDADLVEAMYEPPHKRPSAQGFLNKLVSLQLESLALELVYLDSGRNADMVEGMRETRGKIDSSDTAKSSCVVFLYGSNHDATLLQRLSDTGGEGIAVMAKPFGKELALDLEDKGLASLGLVTDCRQLILRRVTERIGVDGGLEIKTMLEGAEERQGADRAEQLGEMLDVALDDSRTRFSRSEAERCLFGKCLTAMFVKHNEAETGYCDVSDEERMLAAMSALLLSDEKVTKILTKMSERVISHRLSPVDAFIDIVAQEKGKGDRELFVTDGVGELKDELRALLQLKTKKSCDQCF